MPLTYAHNVLPNRVESCEVETGELFDQSSDQCREFGFFYKAVSIPLKKVSRDKFSCCPLTNILRRALGAIDLIVKYLYDCD